MRQRRRAAAATHEHIVSAARSVLDDRGGCPLTLDVVARMAGVSRATVYKQFGSRRALVAAVFEELGRHMQYERVDAALELPDARAALVATVRETCRAWASSREVLRKIFALAVIDAEFGALVARYERMRRRDLAELAARLGAGGDDAGAILGALTSFPVFDAMGADASARLATERLIHTAESMLGLR